VLTTQEAELSSLQNQLSSANAKNDAGTRLLDVLTTEVQMKSDELKWAGEELRGVENDLDVMRAKNTEIQIPMKALRDEVVDLKHQNYKLASENNRLQTRVDQMVNSEKHFYSLSKF